MALGRADACCEQLSSASLGSDATLVLFSTSLKEELAGPNLIFDRPLQDNSELGDGDVGCFFVIDIWTSGSSPPLQNGGWIPKDARIPWMKPGDPLKCLRRCTSELGRATPYSSHAPDSLYHPQRRSLELHSSCLWPRAPEDRMLPKPSSSKRSATIPYSC